MAILSRTDRRIVAFGQLESVWPVHGSVLVVDGLAAAGGRLYLSCLDGKLRCFGIGNER